MDVLLLAAGDAAGRHYSIQGWPERSTHGAKRAHYTHHTLFRGSARRRYALKLGESAAAAHVLDGIEVADDGYDQLFAGHRPQSHKSIIAVQQSTWQSAGARMD